MRSLLSSILIGLIVLLVGNDGFAKEIQAKDEQGRDYWLYVPDRIDPEKTYTLVVGVHGYRGRGKGAGGYAGWVKEHDVIVLGCTYDSNGYQYPQKGSDERTISLVKKLRKEYTLHEKIFVGGFSGGSQYAHRFAMKYPDLVAGCAAHSGGTWATGDYAERAVPNPKARGVLFVISCGEKDTGKSFNEAPMGRLDWAKKYETMLEEGGFVYDAKWVPGVGHSPSHISRQMSRDCFIASTQRLPEYNAERDAIEKAMRDKDYGEAWSLIQRRLKRKDKDDDGILGKVHGLYIDSLEGDIDRIDRMAEREVTQAIRNNKDPEQLALALRKLKADYRGLPDTIALIEMELDKVR